MHLGEWTSWRCWLIRKKWHSCSFLFIRFRTLSSFFLMISFPQAIMYVLCFRMRSILEIPRLKSQLLLMPIGPLLTHRLSPLKVGNWLIPLSLVVFFFVINCSASYFLSLKSTFMIWKPSNHMVPENRVTIGTWGPLVCLFNQFFHIASIPPSWEIGDIFCNSNGSGDMPLFCKFHTSIELVNKKR